MIVFNLLCSFWVNVSSTKILSVIQRVSESPSKLRGEPVRAGALVLQYTQVLMVRHTPPALRATSPN